MGQVALARPIEVPVHPAQQYDCTVAQGSQTPDLRSIQHAMAGVRPGPENRRQKKDLGAGAIGLMDFRCIMDRRAVTQSSDSGPAGRTTMHAIGAPQSGERWGSSQKHHMSAAPGKFFDRFKSRPPQCFLQMIMAKDDPAAARQSQDGLLEKVIIPLVGEQPYPGQGGPRRVRQNGEGLVSQHMQAYRHKLGERE